jgi:hypothetical protein
VLGLLGSVDAALWGDGSVVKRELVALALACPGPGACEVISWPWILKRPLFSLSLSHTQVSATVCLLCSFSVCLDRCGLVLSFFC